MKNLPLDWFDAVSSWACRAKPISKLKVARNRRHDWIEPLESRIAPATASYAGGVLTITGDATSESVAISVSGSDLVVTGVSGYTGQSLADITQIIFKGEGGNDTLSLDLTAADFVGKSISFDGGSGTDSLIINGAAQGAVTYGYTGTGAGTITTSISGTISYTGLESSTNNGTANSLTFNLLAGSTATLGDNGTTGDTLSRLTGVASVTTNFKNPTTYLAVNRGNANDTLTVNALPDFNASLTIGDYVAPFKTITFAGNVAVTGSSTISAYASRNIEISSGTLSVVNGHMELEAYGVATGTEAFKGLEINGTLRTTGSGSIFLRGFGGNSGSDQHGIHVNAGSVESTGSGSLNFEGGGGGGAGSTNNDGIRVDGTVRATGTGNIAFTGYAGVASSSSEGVALEPAAVINTTTGSLTVTADWVRVGVPDGASNYFTAGSITFKPVTPNTPMNLGTSSDGSTWGLGADKFARFSTSSLTLGDAATGPITLSADVEIANVTTLTLNTASSVGVTAGTLKVNTLAVNAGTGTGVTLNTDVRNLSGSTTTGSFNITNTGVLTVGSVNVATSGGINVSTTGPLTLTQNVTAPGAIQFSALEDDDNGVWAQDLVVNGGVAVTSTGGSVTLLAGDDITINGTVNATAGTVTVTAASGDLDSGGSLTIGGAVTASGTITGSARGAIALGANVTSSGGNVSLTSTAGSITQSAGTVSGNTLTFTASAGGIGTSGARISTNGATINASAGAAGIYLTEQDGATLGTLTTANGPVSVTTTTGSLILGTINAGTGSVTLNSAGSITDGNGGTLNVTASTLTITAASGVGAGDAIETAVSNLTASGGTGGINVANTGNLTTGALSATGGGVTVETTEALTVGANVSAPGAIRLSVLDVDDIDIWAQDVVVKAGVAVTSSAGSVTLQAGDDITIRGTVSAPAGTVTLTAAWGNADPYGYIEINGQVTANGAITASAYDWITLSGNVSSTSGDVSLTSTTRYIQRTAGTVSGNTLNFTAYEYIGTSAAPISTSGATINASAGAGGIYLTEQNGATLGNLTTTGNGPVSVTTTTGSLTLGMINAGTGSVTLRADGAGGTIVDNANDNAVDIRGGTIILSANAGIGVGDNGSIDFGSVTGVTASTAAGSIVLNGAGNNLPVTSVTAGGNGDVTLTTTTSGSIQLGAVDAAGNTVTLNSAGSITDANGGTTNVTASTLTITAASGVGAGDAIETTVSNLTASGGTGGLNISNTGNLTTGGLSATGGAVTVETVGALTVGGNVTAPGAITLTAKEIADAPSYAQDLVVNAGVAVTSSGGSVTLLAGDDIIINGTGTVTATAGTVTMTAGSGDLDSRSYILIDGDVTANGAITASAIELIRLGANVTSLSGDVSLTTTAGNITRTAGTVSGNTLSLIASGGVGTSVAPIATYGGTIIASAGVTGIYLTEQDGATLGNLTTANGPVSVTTTTGSLILGTIAAGTGSVTLRADGAGGTIEDDANDSVVDIVGGTITLSANAGIGGGLGGSLDLNGGTINASTSLAGAGIYLTEEDGATLGSITTNNGPVEVSATAGSLTIGSINAGTGNVTLSANGAGGTIVDDVNDAVVDIVGGTITLSANAGIGVGLGGSLDLNGGTINASTSLAGAGIYLTEEDGATLGSITTNNGLVAVSATAGSLAIGSIDAGASSVTLLANGVGGTIVDDVNDAVVDIVGGAITLSADAGIGGGLGGSLDLNGGAINAGTSLAGAGIYLTEEDGATLGSITTNNGPVEVSATAGSLTIGSINAGTGNVTLSADAAGGTIVDDVNDAVVDIVGGTITLSANAGIGVGPGGSLDFGAVTAINASTTDGSIALNGANNDLPATSITAGGGGDITLTTTGSGDIQLGLIDATGDLVTLNSAGSITDDRAGVNVIADTLDATATTGIGVTAPSNELETTVNNLSATTVTGGIGISNTGALKVDGASVTGASGDITITSSGPQTIAGDVTAPGNVTLQATETADSGVWAQDVIVNGGVTIKSTSGATTILAGDDITTTAGSVIAGETGVTLTAGNGDSDNGGAITLNGDIESNGPVTLNAKDEITLAGDIEAGGAVSLTANEDITVGLIDAAGQTITITSNSGAIVDGNDDAVNLIGGDLHLSAATGIAAGDTLETEADNLTATTGTGGIGINNTGALQVDGATAGSGDITIITSGPQTIAGNVTITGTGNVTLQATETADSGVWAQDIIVNGGVTIGANEGTTILQAGDDIVTGAGSTISGADGVTLIAGSGDLDNGGAITLNGDIESDGPVTLNAKDEITLAGDIEAGGAVSLTANEDITVGLIDAAGQTITITSNSGAIIDGNGAATNLIGGDLDLSAATGIGAGNALETTANNLSATTGTGGIGINNTGALQVDGASVTGASGDITIITSGPQTLAGDVTAPGNITLTAVETADSPAFVHDIIVNGGVTVESTSGATTILAGDDITTTAGSVIAGATGVTLTAGYGDLDNHGALNLGGDITSGGPVNLEAKDDITVGLIDASGQTITITSNNGAIIDGNGAATNLIGGDLDLSAATGIGAGNALETTANNLSATTGTGGIGINNTGALQVDGASVTGASGDITIITSGPQTLAGDVTAPGNVTLQATETADSGVWAQDIIVNGGVTIESTSGATTILAGDDITTTAGSVIAGATGVTLIAGNGDLDNGGGINLGGDITSGGPVTLEAEDDITVGLIDASGEKITITSNNGAIIDGNGGAMNLIADELDLTAATGIGATAPGNALETTANNLSATTGTGGIGINNTGALQVDGASVTGASGDITIITSGPQTVAGDVTAPGNITLSATEFPDANTWAQDLVVNPGTTIRSTGGDILLEAGDDITLSTGSNVTATNGAITITAGANDADNGGDLNLNGSITANGDVVATAVADGFINGPITSTNGDVTVITDDQLVVNAVVATGGGGGGVLRIRDNVTLNATPSVGAGDVTLQGGAGDMLITSPINYNGSLSLEATGNIDVHAPITLTGASSDLIIMADRELDGQGGLMIHADGSLSATNDIVASGSNYIGTTEQDSVIIIEGVNPSTPKIAALRDVTIKNNTASPAGTTIRLGGFVRSSGVGNVTFVDAVELTSNNARVATQGGGNILFASTVDSATEINGNPAQPPYNLRAASDTGNITFYGAVGAKSRVGDVNIGTVRNFTAVQGFSATSLLINSATESTVFVGPVDLNGSGVVLDVTTNGLYIDDSVNAHGGDIHFKTENIDIEGDITSAGGNLIIQPQSADRSIGLNGAGLLNLTTTEIQHLQEGFESIQIGSANGSGPITIGAVTFTDKVSILAPMAGGSITVNGTITGSDDAGVTLKAPTIGLNVAGNVIDTAGGAVELTGAVLLGANTTIDTVGATGGEFTQNGTINGAYSFSVIAGTGTINLNGSNSAGGTGIGNSQPLTSATFQGGTVNVRTQIVTTGAQTFAAATTNLESGSIKTTTQAGAVGFTGAVNVASPFSITTGGGSIDFGGDVNATGTASELRLNAGQGNVTFTGAVGAATPPAALTALTIQNATSVLFGSTVDVEGNLSITARGVTFADAVEANALTIQGATNGATFASDVTIAGNILIEADEIDFNGSAGSVSGARIELKPASKNVPTLIGGGSNVAGSLSLTATDLLALADGFTSITIGRDLGEAGLRIVGDLTFRDPVIFEQSGRAGTIDVQANIIGTDSIDFRTTLITFTNGNRTIDAGGAVTFDGVVSFEGAQSVEINTAGGDVLFKAAVRQGALPAPLYGTDLTINAGAGNITFAKTIGARTGATVGAIELISSGVTSLNGAIYADSIGVNRGAGASVGRTDLLAKSITTSGANGQVFNSDILLNSSVRFNPLLGDIEVRGNVTSKVGKTYSISATPKYGNVLFEGDLGTSTGILGNVRAKAKYGTATFNGDIYSKGVSILASEFSVENVTTTVTQSYTGAGTFGGALVSKKLKINSYGDIVSNEAWTITGRTVLKAKGTAGSGKIELTGANEFGEIDILAAQNATIHEVVGDLVIRTANVTDTLTLDATNAIEDGKRIRAGKLIATSGSSITLDAANRLAALGQINAQSDITILSGGTHMTLTDKISSTTGNVIIVGNDRSSHNVIAGPNAEIELPGGGYYRVYTHDSTIGNLLALNPDLVEALGNRYPYDLGTSDNAIIASRIP